MCARGAAGQDKACRVGTVRRSLGVQPGDDPLGIDQLRGKLCRVELIVGSDAYPPEAGEPLQQQPRLPTLGPAEESASVEVDQHGGVRWTVATQVEIKKVSSPCRRPVPEVLDAEDVSARPADRRQNNPQDLPGVGQAAPLAAAVKNAG